MYHRLIVNAMRCTRAHFKRIITDTRASTAQCTVFTNKLPQTYTTRRHYYSNHDQFCKEKTTYVFLWGSIFTIFSFNKEEDESDDLIMLLKRSILLIQRGEHNKAEQMLHVALRTAQTLQNYEGITYTYDVMANLAMDIGEYKKAETLFVTVLQRLMAKGAQKDDIRVIDISLKLAKIFEETNDLEKAEEGYKFCLETLRNLRSKKSDDQEVLLLLCVALDWYGLMLYQQSKFEDALKNFNEAYDIFVATEGREQPQVVNLLSNMGSSSFKTGDYASAVKYLTEAIEIGKKIEDTIDISHIFVNLGHIHMSEGLYHEAKRCCMEGKKMAKRIENVESLKESIICLKAVQGFIKQQQK